MTKFTIYDEESYQFIHLTVQEFLAAWWIAQNNKTIECFENHIDDSKFRMCLKFVAGLTQLKNAQEQIFLGDMHLQCVRRPMFGYKAAYYSWFHQNSEVLSTHWPHCKSPNFLFYLQLLYESQNPKLCHTVAEKLENHSLCLYDQKLSPFDILCVISFLSNSNIEWKCLHFGEFENEKVQVIIDSLKDNIQQVESSCKRLEIKLNSCTNECKLFSLAFFLNIEECYCDILHQPPVPLLLELLGLPKLRVLHLNSYRGLFGCEDCMEKWSQIEKSLTINSVLQEINLSDHSFFEAEAEFSSQYISSIIKGATNNTSVLSLTLKSYVQLSSDIIAAIEFLLKENNVLQALALDLGRYTFNFSGLGAPFSFPDVNITSLNALDIRWNYQLKNETLQKCTSLHCLKLNMSQEKSSLCLPLLIHSQLFLEQLHLHLSTANCAIELFTVLQSNHTVKVLHVKVVNADILELDSVGAALQEMLKLNTKMQYFVMKVDDTRPTPYSNVARYEFTPIPCAYLPYLTAGLENNSYLNGLNVPIPLFKHTSVKQIERFFNIISNKRSPIVELELSLVLDCCYCQCDKIQRKIFKLGHRFCKCNEAKEREEMLRLYYTLIIPFVIKLLETNQAIKLLKIGYPLLFYGFVMHSERINHLRPAESVIQQLIHTFTSHPSIQYLELVNCKVKVQDLHIPSKKIPKCEEESPNLIMLKQSGCTTFLINGKCFTVW